MKKATAGHLHKLKTGDRMFKSKSDLGKGSDDYQLYTVVARSTEGPITLQGVFDEQEMQKTFEPEQMLAADCWWYNPSFD